MPPRARPRRPAPPLTAACSRALSLPQSWSRYQVSPRGFTPRPGKREAAQLAAGRLIADHGLAYMAAKNIVSLTRSRTF